jgi:short subunit dehydrogenase-like uncharacterized protein
MAAVRKYDLVILGATGFTGSIACEYLCEHYPSLAWLATGRSETKLKKLRTTCSAIPETAILDVTDAARLDEVVRSARAVANFAGTPFLNKALPVVEACARHGTHYVDITGETPLQRASYDRHHKAAVASGAIILHQCGYDSVPSDLAAFLAVNHMRQTHGSDVTELHSFAGKSRGGLSGGTLATVIQLALSGALKKMPGVKESLARGAYALDPEGATGGPDRELPGAAGSGFQWPLIGRHRYAGWFMPFVMAGPNTAMVRKSSALLRWKTPRVSEHMAVPGPLSALLGLAGLLLGFFLLALPPVRALGFALRLLPRPGEGPSRRTRDTGFFHMYCVADGGGGAPTVVGHVRSGDAGDPGYKATARMCVEAALCTVKSRDLCAAGGVLTPASALGDVYVQRLNASGMQLTAETLDAASAGARPPLARGASYRPSEMKAI